MAGDGGVRVGVWEPDAGDTADGQPAAEAEPTTAHREWWEDMPDPWDRLPYRGDDDTPTDEHPIVPGRKGRTRRSGKDAALRRGAMIVVLVGVVMVGAGAAANLLKPEPTAFPAPPTPPERAVTSAPDGDARLGNAPSADPSPGPPGSFPASAGAATTAPTADPDQIPSPGASPPSPAGAGVAGALSFEAEEAQLGGLANSYSSQEASGGRAVQTIGMWGLNYVEFRDVTVPGAGEYELTFHYLGNRDRTGRFSVNDGPLINVDFPGLADNDSIGSVTVTVELVDGDNAIWFGGSGIFPGPDLDRITVAG